MECPGPAVGSPVMDTQQLFAPPAVDDMHLTLVDRFKQLHEMLYMRGGIKSSSAAVEELAKLLLIQIAAERSPDVEVIGHGREEGDLEWDSERGVSSPRDALRLLTDRADTDRYVPGCPTCARDDDEQSWGIDIYSYVTLSDELEIQMLDALWYPCEEHPSGALKAFGARWTWSGTGWTRSNGG